MTEYTLDLIGRQLERVLHDTATLRDNDVVHQAMIESLERHVQLLEHDVRLLSVEQRALHALVSRIDARLRKLEDV